MCRQWQTPAGTDRHRQTTADTGRHRWAPADIDECVRAALRFAVGDSVECCVNADLGLWARGTVVRHFFREAKWPEGRYAPYQIKVESFFDETTGKEHEGAFIWAPEDSDACIRKARPGGQ